MAYVLDNNIINISIINNITTNIVPHYTYNMSNVNKTYMRMTINCTTGCQLYY